MRTIAADDLWLSGQYHRNSISLHCTWRRQPEAVARACAEIERTLAPFSPRAHWGKVCGLSAATIADSLPRLTDFLTLREQFDPSGKFLNAWLRDKLLGA
jgi:xylitol oxidase